MKTLFTFLLLLFSLFVKGDYWTRKADVPGGYRWGAVGFSIGAKGYIGTSALAQSDFWEYDPALNLWTQKASMGLHARAGAISFSIGNKGYVGTGRDSSSHKVQNDFWEYDPATNMWSQKANFGGVARAGAFGISIGFKGYIGVGADSSFSPLKDFWQYDPANNTWIQKADYGGGLTVDAIGFSIAGKGYAGTGIDLWSSFYLCKKDFWEYDTLTNVWTKKADVGGIARVGAVSMAIGNYGYIGTGESDSTSRALKDFWQYDPANNSWVRKADFGGAIRAGAAGFAIGNKGYIGTGSFDGQYYTDFYEYTPDSTTAINEPPSSSFHFQLFPNPAHQSLVVSWQALGEKKVEIRIIDIKGAHLSASGGFKSPSFGGVGGAIIDISGLAAGIYFLVADDGVSKAVRKFAKE